MENVGQQVRWAPEPILVQEGPPLALLIEEPMEVEEIGTVLVQEDDNTA